MVRIVGYGCSVYFKARFHVQILSVFEKEPEICIRQSLISRLNFILSSKLPLFQMLKLKQALNSIFSVKKPNIIFLNGCGAYWGSIMRLNLSFITASFLG